MAVRNTVSAPSEAIDRRVDSPSDFDPTAFDDEEQGS